MKNAKWKLTSGRQTAAQILLSASDIFHHYGTWCCFSGLNDTVLQTHLAHSFPVYIKLLKEMKADTINFDGYQWKLGHMSLITNLQTNEESTTSHKTQSWVGATQW
jgi:hypothetical protein